MSQLEAMGFPVVRCQKALLATGNSDAEMAMTWLFEHMEDPGELPGHDTSLRQADGQTSMTLSRRQQPRDPSHRLIRSR